MWCDHRIKQILDKAKTVFKLWWYETCATDQQDQLNILLRPVGFVLRMWNLDNWKATPMKDRLMAAEVLVFTEYA